MSRDSVSGDVSFHRPAVELLVVTMHIRAQLRDTKSGFHRSILRVIGGNFTAIFSTRVPTTSGCSRIYPFMTFFVILPKLQIALSVFFFFCTSLDVVGVDK